MGNKHDPPPASPSDNNSNRNNNQLPFHHHHQDAQFQQHVLKRRRLESRIIQEFEHVLGRKLATLDRWDIVKQEQGFVRKFLGSVGAMEGATAAVVAFFCLNRVPRYWARHVARKQHKQQSPSSSYVLEHSIQKTPAASPFRKPSQQQLEKQVARSRHRFLFTTFEFLFDAGMSLGVGIGVSFLMADQAEAQKSVTDIPLQPGQSFLSDCCCHDLVEEYKRQWNYFHQQQKQQQPADDDDIRTKGPPQSQQNDQNNGNGVVRRKSSLLDDRRGSLLHPQMQTLQTLVILTGNCRHRQVMEEQLREEQGLPSSAPVAIPDTGVIPLSEDPLVTMMLQLEEEEEEHGSHDFHSGLWTQQHVATLVRDQESKEYK